METMATYVTSAGTWQMLQWPVETWATLTSVSCKHTKMTVPFSRGNYSNNNNILMLLP